MTTENTQMILQLVISILGILIPFGIKYAIDHIGKDKMQDALKLANLAKTFIIGYFEINPTAKKDIENIITMFKERISLTTKLSSSELDFLWQQISADVLKALNIELSDTAKVAMVFQNKIDTDKKQKLLFK